MAEKTAGSSSSSHSVALVVLLPPHLASPVDTLRCANDKAWPRWPAHVTVLFPFGALQDIDQNVQSLREALLSSPSLQPFPVTLTKVGWFNKRDYETVHLCPSPSSASDDPLTILWKTAVKALTPNAKNSTQYNPHTTLGQTAPDSLSLLTDKAATLLERHAPFSWLVDRVVVLRKREDKGGAMEMYAELPIGPNTELVPREYLHPMSARSPPTCHFNFETSTWTSQTPPPVDTPLSSLTVATLNILHDPSIPITPRLSALVNALMSTSADILCLQEVADTALPLLLDSPLVRARWPWCSRAPNTVFESERNIVLLAREEFAFDSSRVELGGGRHKACLVARLVRPLASSPPSSIVLAGVHLSAGRTPTAREKRKAELDALVSHLRAHHSADEWVVLGDVNWPASQGDFPYADVLVDVWGGGDVQGATYDPTANPLAAATAREGFRDPERYDRVFVKRGGRLGVQHGGLDLFGFPGEDGVVGSDHWGISVTVEMQGVQKEEAAIPILSSHFQLPKTSLTDGELHELCSEKGYIPSKAQDEAFGVVVDVLRDFFTPVPSAHDDHSPTDDDHQTTSHPPAVRFVASPVGSFAMGCHTSSSDIDCMVVGNVSAKSFWILVQRKIRASGNRGPVRLRRFVKDAQVQVMELAVNDVKVDLQYCPAVNVVERWKDLPNLPTDSPLFHLPSTALRILNAHRDAQTLLAELQPSLPAFCLAHRALKLFLTSHGLVGTRFGFLGGFPLACLLAHAVLRAPPTGAGITAAQLVRLFLRVYARWDWEHEVVDVSGCEGSGYRRSEREPMVVLSRTKPQVNVTANASVNSLQALTAAFSTADRALEEGRSWREVCGLDGREEPFDRFLKGYQAFVKIEVIYWGSGCVKGRGLVGWLESRFVGLLVALHACAPSVCAHLWPARFAEKSTISEESLHGFYLIGLSAKTVSTKPDGKSLARDLEAGGRENAITAALRAFEEEIHSNARHYDSAEAFVSVAYERASQLPSDLVLDGYRWSDGGYEDVEEEEEDEVDGVVKGKDEDYEGGEVVFASALKKKNLARAKGTPPKSHIQTAAKLRTSLDVYNRLMWDPAVAKEDYAIGYEDRFDGVKEVPLGSWKREVEDEAFIPFHRVVHLRRKSDNVVVWDRRKKVDLLFAGSGVERP